MLRIKPPNCTSQRGAGRRILNDFVHLGRTATLYKLFDSAGNFLKWGISQNPATRYTKAFMQDKYMILIQSRPRHAMLNLERVMAETKPGP
jgi:hypothetical protein